MKKELSTSECIDMLIADEYNGWKYEEAKLIVEGLEELENELDSDISFNVVDIRCEYNCEHYEDIIAEGYTDLDDLLEEAKEEENEDTFQLVLDYLQENTFVLNYNESTGVIAYTSF